MARIRVKERFSLCLDRKSIPIRFTVGEHEVSDEVARHPYVARWSEVLELSEAKPKVTRRRKVSK